MPVKILPLYWGGIFFVLLFWVVDRVVFRAENAKIDRKVREGYSLCDTLCVLCDTLCSNKKY